MAKFDVFVGRKKELALIDEWAGSWGTPHWILIGGIGGIGKTFLLQKIAQKYRRRDNFVVSLFDLAEHPPGTLRETLDLAASLGWENFTESRAKFNDLASGKYDIADIRLPQLERDALATFVRELNQYLSQKRLIRLIDTLDIEGERPVAEEFFQYAPEVSNFLGISAGRQARSFLNDFENKLGKDNVTYVELESFNQVESSEFFAEVDQQALIPSDIRAKLHLLTEGRPVLLSLAVDWLSHNVPLPEIADVPLPALKNLPQDEMHELRRRFEFELVNQVRRLKGPLDRAVLYMAHVSRRSDARLLSALLEVPIPDARALMEELTELSFVKYNPATGNCMLHDEMKNLVNHHAWPYVDPTGDVRRKLARKVITDHYEPRINELARQTKAQLEPDKGPVRRATIGGAEWELWRLEAESLHYHLKVGPEEGMAYFEDRFLEAQRNHHLMRMQFLLGEMEAAGHTGIRDTLELRRADTLRLRGQVKGARAIVEELLQKETLSPDNRISAHNIIGSIAVSRTPPEARRHYETALRLARQEDNTKVVGILHNNLGQLYQLTSQLDQAITHYQRAIEASKRADNQPLVASATNNLAYVYRLRGDLAQADVLCRVAMAQRKRLGLERDLAYSYLTKGEIDRDRGDLESAERHTKLALRSFDKVGEIRGQIMAYSSMANIRRHIEQYQDAEAYLERGIALAEQINDEPLLADLFNAYGREQRDRAVYLQELNAAGHTAQIAGFFQRAKAYLERSYELARQYGDQWLIARSRFELALAYFLSRSRSDDEVIEMLDRVWDDVVRLDDKLLQGYVLETRGEIAQRQQDYAEAARHFGRSALLIAQRSGREPERFFDRLGNRLLDTRLAPSDARTLAHGILQVIEEAQEEKALRALQMLCQQVLDLYDT